jgi:hypothetical protein
MSETTSGPAAGWYTDPRDPALYRFWDGTGWTEHRAPKYRQQTPPVKAPGNGLSAAAMVCGLCAFVIIPPLLGGAGIVLSAIGLGKGERWAFGALIVSLAGLVLGMYLGAKAAAGQL